MANSAGIYIKRAGFKVLIISKGEGALIRTEKIENYYNDGKDLVQILKQLIYHLKDILINYYIKNKSEKDDSYGFNYMFVKIH